MKTWKTKLMVVLFALGGLGWLIKPLKQLIRGESLDAAPIVFGCMFLCFAAVFLARSVAAARKAEGGSPAPSA